MLKIYLIVFLRKEKKKVITVSVTMTKYKIAGNSTAQEAVT